MQRFVGLCSQHEINTIVNTIGYYLSFPLSLLPLFLFITQCTSIEHAADTPANYVLRGELYFSAKEYALAKRDFQRAHELAESQFESSDWGLMAQAMEDRALIGLQKAEKKLPDESL